MIITKPIDWCAKRRLYGKYHIVINNKIAIRKKQFFDKFKNKFIRTNSVKFYLINLLSLFQKGSKIYFTDKDSDLYKLYEFDRDRNKVFVSDALDNKYKLMVLSAEKIITDKTIKEVIPFGKMTKNYIAASSFELEIFEEEGEESEEGLH